MVFELDKVKILNEGKLFNRPVRWYADNKGIITVFPGGINIAVRCN